MKKLVSWKNSSHRKPMVVRGARQVGKTWLMREFGRLSYESVVYVNMDGNETMQRLFDLDYDISRIINGLEIASGAVIHPGSTLIILDEIQEVPRALTSLKYFYENAPEYHIVVAGSLLGVALHEGTSFPVGKVDFIDLYPLCFIEFLRATGDDSYADLLTAPSKDVELIETFAPKIIDALRKYYITGGMPEVVDRYVHDGNLLATRQVQEAILNAYEQDFSKHAPNNIVPRLREVWNAIPAQLAKENKKFIFRQVREGARGREYNDALVWLQDTGLATRVTRVNKPGLPLIAYEDRGIFKLFCLDVGLLGAMSGLNPQIILDGDRIFEEFKGSLAEQFVFQELTVLGVEPHYFANDASRGEVDFIIQRDNEVVPIEVKSGVNVRARSLSAFVEKYSPNHAIRLSMKPYRHGRVIEAIPLYMINAAITNVDEHA